jgi:hypothetical protein
MREALCWNAIGVLCDRKVRLVTALQENHIEVFFVVCLTRKSALVYRSLEHSLCCTFTRLGLGTSRYLF